MLLMMMIMLLIMMLMVLPRFCRAATPPVREYEDEGTACGGCLRRLQAPNQVSRTACGETSGGQQDSWKAVSVALRVGAS